MWEYIKRLVMKRLAKCNDDPVHETTELLELVVELVNFIAEDDKMWVEFLRRFLDEEV